MLENINSHIPLESKINIDIQDNSKLINHKVNILHFPIKAIDSFIGGFEAYNLNYIESNDHYLFDLLHQLCVKAVISFNQDVIFIDGGNSFNPYVLTAYCKRYRVKAKHVLSKIKISRAFTAYQLSSIVEDGLRNIINGASLVVVSRMIRMYRDEDVRREEAYVMFERGIKKLNELTKKFNLISILTSYNSFRYFSFRKIIHENVDKVVRIENNRNKYLRFKMGEHILDYYPVPMYQMTLDDFL